MPSWRPLSTRCSAPPRRRRLQRPRPHLLRLPHRHGRANGGSRNRRARRRARQRSPRRHRPHPDRRRGGWPADAGAKAHAGANRIGADRHLAGRCGETHRPGLHGCGGGDRQRTQGGSAHRTCHRDGVAGRPAGRLVRRAERRSPSRREHSGPLPADPRADAAAPARYRSSQGEGAAARTCCCP